MARTLVIGFGNLDRGDDGAAFHIVNRLRQDLGMRPLEEGEIGLTDLGGETDAVFVRQLLPEYAVEAAGYERLVLVDAHVAADQRDIVCARLNPEQRLSVLGHILPPSTFLWLAQNFSGRSIEAYAVSVRGRSFKMAEGLSKATAALVPAAADAVRGLLHSEDRPPLCRPNPFAGQM
jgi:hydrogenase maturation protease